MKVLIVNTGPEHNDALFRAAEMLGNRLEEGSFETEHIWTGTGELRPCIACGKCNRMKKCVYEDIVNELAGRAGEFDALLILAEAYYGQLSTQSLAFLERLFRSAAPAFSGKTAAGIISVRGNDAKEAAEDLNHFFSMSDMTVITSRSRQVIHQDLDEEDEKNMILLAERIIWDLRCMEAAKEKGIISPKWQTDKVTDYVR